MGLTGNGTVRITAKKDSAGAWTSARLETVRSDFTCKAGGKMRIQGSLALPDLGEKGVGYWPAFWALGGNFRPNFQDWPQVGELDIMENVNARNKLFGTLHCGVNPGGPCDETTGLSGETVPTSSPLQGNMHTYTIEVDRTDSALEMIKWSLDGTVYHTVNSTVMEAATWAAAVHNTYFIILNLAIGGSFPDKDHGSTTPIESTAASGDYLIDYVAVYNSV